MEGASEGTAQQRPLTGERVKGRRKEGRKKKAARLLKWLTYLFNAGAEINK